MPHEPKNMSVEVQMHVALFERQKQKSITLDQAAVIAVCAEVAESYAASQCAQLVYEIKGKEVEHVATENGHITKLGFVYVKHIDTIAKKYTKPL